MRAVLAIVFVVFFVISLVCGLVLGGPPSSVYRVSDFIIVVAESMLFLAGLVLIALVAGFGSEGKERSLWRLPVLCLLATFLSFVFGLAIFTSDMRDLTPQHAAINLRLKIYAGTMLLYGIFTGLCCLIAYLLAKRHNSKLSS